MKKRENEHLMSFSVLGITVYLGVSGSNTHSPSFGKLLPFNCNYVVTFSGFLHWYTSEAKTILKERLIKRQLVYNRNSFCNSSDRKDPHSSCLFSKSKKRVLNLQISP